eukprot:gnl/MRDRNA2_/MRDRNA2_86163_c0_seq1.p1 gnl/MRDRNA2_/MRDRNA2_86163_c0~~gnl/MRDRNA2_/MRDRNA2_86163_c0_seq1.p1  ORF type:complete len:394 (+),score=25.56 gnl/MRDRNA2_/MRDRNA2_86163_c0_seq1:44-1225(+)
MPCIEEDLHQTNSIYKGCQQPLKNAEKRISCVNDESSPSLNNTKTCINYKNPIFEKKTSTSPFIMNENVHQNLDYFDQIRGSKNVVSLNPLEKAAVHAAQYLTMDPLEKMRRQVDQTLQAKLGLIQTKLDNARDPKNKTQRKIYVGNITPSINGEFLKQLFTQTLLIMYPQWNIPGQDCVVEVQYRDGNKYCFLEFCSMEMASAAIQVNGVNILDTQLQVSRPTGFLDPLECERAVHEAERELQKFRSGQDETPLLRQPGYSELVTKIKGPHFRPESITNEEKLLESSYLSFDGIVTAAGLDSVEEVKELYQDIKDKADEFGGFVRLVIPRPPVGMKGSEVFGKGQYGKAFVEFSSSTSALSALQAIDGMVFDGRTVSVQFVSEKDFLRAYGL